MYFSRLKSTPSFPLHPVTKLLFNLVFISQDDIVLLASAQPSQFHKIPNSSLHTVPSMYLEMTVMQGDDRLFPRTPKDDVDRRRRCRRWERQQPCHMKWLEGNFNITAWQKNTSNSHKDPKHHSCLQTTISMELCAGISTPYPIFFR